MVVAAVAAVAVLPSRPSNPADLLAEVEGQEVEEVGPDTMAGV